MSSGSLPHVTTARNTMDNSTAVADINSSLPSTGTNGTCIDREDSTVVILTCIPLFALLFNVIVLIAVILHRSKLRQNNIYIYVFSVLLSNILFNVLGAYQLLNHYYQFEGDPTNGSNALRNWWVFRKSLLPSVYLIMIANIGALIFAIQSGNNIVAKAANAQTSNHWVPVTSAVEKQRKRAKVIVCLAWIFPLTLALLTLTGWNCGGICNCLSGCYTVEVIEKDQTRSCSRVLSAVSNSYMAVVFAIWVVEIAVLFFMICKTLSHSLLLSAGCLEREADRDEAAEEKEVDHKDANEALSQGDPSLPKLTSELSQDHENRRSRKKSRRSQRVERRQRRHARWLRQASKQLAYLTVLFFVCTLPSMVTLMLDIFQQEMITQLTTSILIALPILYSIICPIILAKDLAGLKSAMVALILKLFPGTKTKGNSSANTSSSVSEK